jgi:hypothetical protein
MTTIYDGSVCIKMFNWFAEVDTGQFNHTQEGQTVSFLRYSEVESVGMEWADVGSERTSLSPNIISCYFG